MEFFYEKSPYIIEGSISIFISVCLVMVCKNKIYKCIKNHKIIDKKNLSEIKIDSFEIIEKISNKKKLYCTHCGYKFFISEVSFTKIIKCDKCNKNLDLPKSYYKINSIV